MAGNRIEAVLQQLRTVFPGIPKRPKQVAVYSALSIVAFIGIGWLNSIGEWLGPSPSDSIQKNKVTENSSSKQKKTEPIEKTNKESEIQDERKTLFVESVKLSSLSPFFIGPRYSSLPNTHHLSSVPTRKVEDEKSVLPASDFENLGFQVGPRTCYVPDRRLDDFYLRIYGSTGSENSAMAKQSLPTFEVLIRNDLSSSTTLLGASLRIKRVEYTGYSAGGEPPSFATPIPVHGKITLVVSAYSDRQTGADFEDPIHIPANGGKARVRLTFLPDMDADHIPRIWVGRIALEFSNGLALTTKEICVRHPMPD